MFDAKAIFLVVDDYEPMRKVTVNQLRGLGVANVLTAANGAEALRILRAQPVDMVLSDWNMPVMSGLDLPQAMRADASLDAVPFIMITAEAERSQVQEAIASGVTYLMLKPYTPNRLASQIEKAFLNRGRRPAKAPQIIPAPQPLDITKSPDKLLMPDPNASLPLVLIVDDVPDNPDVDVAAFQRQLPGSSGSKWG